MKGQFTLANMLGIAILLFLFGILAEPITSILSSAAQGSRPMLSTLLKGFPLVFIMILVILPFAKSEKKRIQRRREALRGRETR